MEILSGGGSWTLRREHRSEQTNNPRQRWTGRQARWHTALHRGEVRNGDYQYDNQRLVRREVYAQPAGRAVTQTEQETPQQNRPREHNWKATPERLFFKCVLGVLIRTGMPMGVLVAKFKLKDRSRQPTVSGCFVTGRIAGN
jgi:hypothetical protein